MTIIDLYGAIFEHRFYFDSIHVYMDMKFWLKFVSKTMQRAIVLLLTDFLYYQLLLFPGKYLASAGDGMYKLLIYQGFHDWAVNLDGFLSYCENNSNRTKSVPAK